MHKVRNKPQYFVTTEKLTDDVCLCDDAQIM
jgi:hypothetical protein